MGRPFHGLNDIRTMRYELYYWPSIQGRGEFVRLALEAAGADYVDVARGSERDGLGMPAMTRLMESAAGAPFAPPFLKVGDRLISHAANILQYLGPRLDLVPTDEAGRVFAHGLQLTITDFVKEIHDTHHPIASSLYYEDQQPEAARRSTLFLAERIPKYLGYFERTIAGNDGVHSVGAALSYVDLSLFQIVAGLRYAFPNAMRQAERAYPRLVAVHDRVMTVPNVARYLASPRRIAFNEKGVFRHYPELDAGS